MEAQTRGYISGGDSDDELSTRRIELKTVAKKYQDAFEHVSDRFGGKGGTQGSVSNCRSFKLRVRAHEDKTDGPEVNIWISMTPEYPNTEQSLELDVEAVGGTSDEKVKELQSKLRNLVRELVGKEMVFDLAKAAQEFLHAAASGTPAAQESKVSGMASPTKPSEKVVKNGNGLQQDGMKQSSLFFRQQQLMSQRFRWKRVMTYRTADDGKTTMAPEVLGIGRFGTVYMAMAEFNTPGALPHAGSVFAIKEFTLRKDAMRQGQVDKIVAEVECQRKMIHKNIVKVYGAEMDTGIFRIFLEYMPMGSVAALLRMMGPLDEDVVRTFTQQLLCGVAFMHSNGVVHRDIKPANLLLGINGVLKVSDFGEAKWLPNVVKDAEHAMLQSMHGTTRYMAPEVIRRQYTIAADVWSIGCTVLEMLTGVMPYSSLSNDMAVARCVLRNEEPPLVPSGLSEECHKFLLRCFTRDPDQRPSAAQLLTDPFVCGSVGGDLPISYPSENSSQSQSMSPMLAASDADSGERAGSSEKSSEDKSEKESNRSHNSLCNSPQPMSNVSEESGEHMVDSFGSFGNFGLSVSSRYKQEFEELHWLGEGGFGAVWMCRNRLDGQKYAIKKIRLDPSNAELNKKLLREVKTLSGLHHQNVVRYYQAWIESVVDHNGSLRDHLDKLQEGGERDQQMLYIQMEYCQKTLSEVIADEGLADKGEVTWKLFRQLVSGLAYIHSKGIVHRDLKPKNIFLDFSGDIKIGDLGLARYSQKLAEQEDTEDARGGQQHAYKDNDESSAHVGTMLYLAPEIMNEGGGGGRRAYKDQSKRDIYAIGIVLFEMWCRFDNVLERITSIDRLRRMDVFPDGFERMQVQANRSNVCQLIRWLTHPDPNTRPSALEILESELLPRPMLESEIRQVLGSLQSKPELRVMLMEALNGKLPRTGSYNNLQNKHRQQDFKSNFLTPKWMGNEDVHDEME